MNTSQRILLWIIVIVAFLGFLDATYLTVQHYMNTVPPCSATQGCERVLTSQYATVAGIPVALGGVLYYLAVFVLAFWMMMNGLRKTIPLLFGLTIIGLVTSAVLVYLQLGVLQAICLYCMGSAISSTLLFVFGFSLFLQSRTKPERSAGE